MASAGAGASFTSVKAARRAVDGARDPPHTRRMVRYLFAAALFGIASACGALRAEAQTADPAAPAPAEPRPVDVELLLAVDVSYSMTPNELEIQRRGYAEALRDPEIARAVASGYYGAVAIAYVEWSGPWQQRVVAPWTLVATAADLDAFAARLTATFEPILRRTSISGALDFAPAFFDANGFAGDRRVIDVSGDGPNNIGRPVLEARDALVAAGYAINGLPLMTREGEGAYLYLEDLDLYYENCVIGGPLSFSIPVKSWEEFLPAVRQKLILELAGRSPDPEPELRQVPAQWRGGGDDRYDCLIGEKMWDDFIRNNPGFEP